MKFDPPGSYWVTTWPWPEVKFWKWPFKVIKHMVRTELTRETRWCHLFCPSSFSSKVICKNKIQENGHFWISWFLEPKLLTLSKFWGHNGESLFQELSNLFFRFILARIVLEIFGGFRNNVNFRKIWPLMTCSDLNIDLSEKNVEVVSKWIVTSFRTLFFVFRYDQ